MSSTRTGKIEPGGALVVSIDMRAMKQLFADLVNEGKGREGKFM